MTTMQHHQPLLSTTMSTATKTKDTIQTELKDIAAQSQTAVLSGTWIYPVSGVIYVATHPALYRAVFPVLLKCLMLSVGITLGMFLFTYLPQVALCTLFSGPILSWAAAALLVLSESYAMILFFSKALYLDRAQAMICKSSPDSNQTTTSSSQLMRCFSSRDTMPWSPAGVRSRKMERVVTKRSGRHF